MTTHAHLILFVRDQLAANRFCRHFLVREPTLDVPGMTEFELGPATILGLMPERGISRRLAARHGPCDRRQRAARRAVPGRGRPRRPPGRALAWPSPPKARGR